MTGFEFPKAFHDQATVEQRFTDKKMPLSVAQGLGPHGVLSEDALAGAVQSDAGTEKTVPVEKYAEKAQELTKDVQVSDASLCKGVKEKIDKSYDELNKHVDQLTIGNFNEKIPEVKKAFEQLKADTKDHIISSDDVNAMSRRVDEANGTFNDKLGHLEEKFKQLTPQASEPSGEEAEAGAGSSTPAPASLTDANKKALEDLKTDVKNSYKVIQEEGASLKATTDPVGELHGDIENVGAALHTLKDASPGDTAGKSQSAQAAIKELNEKGLAKLPAFDAQIRRETANGIVFEFSQGLQAIDKQRLDLKGAINTFFDKALENAKNPQGCPQAKADLEKSVASVKSLRDAYLAQVDTTSADLKAKFAQKYQAAAQRISDSLGGQTKSVNPQNSDPAFQTLVKSRLDEIKSQIGSQKAGDGGSGKVSGGEGKGENDKKNDGDDKKKHGIGTVLGTAAGVGAVGALATGYFVNQSDDKKKKELAVAAYQKGLNDASSSASSSSYGGN